MRVDMAMAVVELVSSRAGLTDREIAEAIAPPGARPQVMNQVCRRLAARGILERRVRPDGLIGNFLGWDMPEFLQSKAPARPGIDRKEAQLTEDRVKRLLRSWLGASGWAVKVAWRQTHGIDVRASQGTQTWIIEAKGCGSRSAMRVNYFLAMLGELLQRMTEPAARYSIAMPDMPEFRHLWDRLPKLAKERTQITALFVRADGGVEESKT